jgi:hypothetical protein
LIIQIYEKSEKIAEVKFELLTKTKPEVCFIIAYLIALTNKVNLFQQPIQNEDVHLESNNLKLLKYIKKYLRFLKIECEKIEKIEYFTYFQQCEAWIESLIKEDNFKSLEIHTHLVDFNTHLLNLNFKSSPLDNTEIYLNCYTKNIILAVQRIIKNISQYKPNLTKS